MLYLYTEQMNRWKIVTYDILEYLANIIYQAVDKSANIFCHRFFLFFIFIYFCRYFDIGIWTEILIHFADELSILNL